MDRFARHILNGKAGRGICAILLPAFLLVCAGCEGGRYAMTPPPGTGERAADNTAPAKEWLPPAVKTEGPGEAAKAIAAKDNVIDNAAKVVPRVEAPGARPQVEAVAPADGRGHPSAEAGGEAPAPVAPSATPAPKPSVPAPPPHEPAPTGGAGSANGTSTTHKARTAAAPHPGPAVSAKAAAGSLPGWARSPEELVYRVDFIGITMGYARFRYQGKVSIAGKPAFHLNVRAWTSGVLSYIFPINETIDYYLDTETLAPIRQEFTEREKAKDDVALYDQETGRITYRYRETGKIRKQVVTVPSVYDPVSVAYYFRWRDLGVENRPRNVYGGRKIYQISSRILGNERIRTEHGEVDTIAVLPLIRRDGKPDDKGDLKVWFSNDERRVPVRLYAKFHKIKDWTLVGVLMSSSTAKAGG